ncbi:MAG: TIGR03663 family protein, partial [Anaerolineaceae bacterium]
MATTSYDESHSENALTRLFSRSVVLNWELVLYIVILALAIFTRFYMLGDRAMSHDESLHTVFSRNLFADGNYRHDPMMHGPILFHITALSYAMFGVDDASSRFYPALLGVLMVMFPLLLRRWLGRTGAVLVAVMLLISPLLLYYNRYIRHDTPSILSGMLLFWAAMMYISGPQAVRRKAYWLYIIAGAMIWNLGSKETAFIYIAIFGAFLTIYWLTRVYQHYFHKPARLLFYTIIMSILMAGVVTLAMVVVISISLGQYPTLDDRLNFIGREFGALMRGESVTVAFLTFLAWSGLTFVLTLSVVIGTAIWAYQAADDADDDSAAARRVTFAVTDVLVGTLSILLLLAVTQWLSHRTMIDDFGNQVRVSMTAASAAVGLILSLSLVLIYAAVRVRLRRGFTRPMLVILGMIFVVFTVLIIGEELSHESSRIDQSTQVMQQPDPFAPDEIGVHDDALSLAVYPLVIAWVLAGLVVGWMVYFKMKGWWREVRHFPELDVLIVMGSLILPWLTAVFIRMAASDMADWTRIGQALSGWSNVLPVMSVEQIGQFVIGLMAFLPMALIAIAVGLSWNWRRWLIAAAVFHVLFALFFTTIFSNIQGLASGMVYSLQYWMEQQGVRRGSQPQYYYTNIIMPMYEYLPVIGSMLAMIAGWVFFWRKRGRYDDEMLAAAEGEYAGDQSAIDDRTPIVHLTKQEVEEAQTARFAAQEALTHKIWPVFWWPVLIVLGVALTLFSLLIYVGQNVRVLGVLTVDHRLLALFGVLVVVVGVVGFLWTWPRAIETLRGQTHLSPGDPFAEVADETMERQGWRLDYVPFLLFVGWWAIFNLFGYTLAGEKMPWLGTHLTVPLILLAGWYFGRIIERIDAARFVNNGWLLLLMLPLWLVALFQMILPSLGGQPPFTGTSQIALGWTYSWLAAAAIFVGFSAAIGWLAMRYTGWSHVQRMLSLVVFVMLAVLTTRTAWVANYINYDLPTEFAVYAHAGPANKFVTDQLLEMSLRVTGGTDMRVMYDHRFSWPGSWYLRDFSDSGAIEFIGANTPTQQQLEDVVAVLVGSDMNPRVEPLLEDAFQRFDYVRMWWPMQDYFNLSASDINNILDFTDSTENLKRRGLFDIWWARDYTRYAEARHEQGFTFSNYTLTDWPVSDPLFVYIRRDVAAQVWQYGIGDSQVLNPFTEIQPNLCIENYVQIPAQTIFTDSQNPLVRPMGLTVADGLLYVANDSDAGARINIFTLDGEPVETFGEFGGAEQEGAFFNRPNSLVIAPDGGIFVVDTWNFRVRAFDADREFITAWGQPQTDGFDASQLPEDGFWGPRDIALDPDGNVLVSDTGNKRIRVYDPDGTFRFDIGRGGAGSGQLNEPSGIAVHPDGRVFVADTWNQRIAVFDSFTGGFIENYDLRAWREGTGNRPYIALDVERDLIYVTDPDDRRVLVLDINGDCIGSFGGRADAGVPSESQFSDMGGIAVDEDGNVYVADTA